MLERLKARARGLKQDTLALYFAARDPRTPWYAKLLVAGVVAYAFSPIDLIPDFIPVVGYLDDLLIVPAGLALAMRLVPPEVMADSRAQAQSFARKPQSRLGAAIIITIWLATALLTLVIVRNTFNQGAQ